MFSLAFKPFFLASVFGISCALAATGQLKSQQTNHQIRPLLDTDLRHLANLRNVSYTNEVLDNILIPRVVGTEGHEIVFRYLTTELQNLNWHVEVDQFRTKVPIFGALTFKNIIATLNPNADRYLVLACHYDSKYFENEVFVGATDSAVPCAMMLNLAKVLNNELQKIRDRKTLSLKLLFLDGEEAFDEWGPQDSIYGARHLASKYHKTNEVTSQGEQVTHLQKIDVFVLLDLIGSSSTSFHSHFTNTAHWFGRMADTEDRLKNLRIINPRRSSLFKRQLAYGKVEDDHLPFMRRNVPILHLISTPFPREWHTPNDNRNIIDLELVENVNTILRIFVAEYLHIYPPESETSDTSTGIPEKEL